MKKDVIKLLEKITPLKRDEIEKVIEIPPNNNMGDFAFPCYTLSKKLKKNPIEICASLSTKINIPETSPIDKIEAKGPYLNFFINKILLAEQTIKQILENKENYGRSNLGKRKVLMIEFSQPNTHKAFHIGHIRGTSLGESLARISEFNGKKVIRANYQGDTGMHVAKWLWCYINFHKKDKLSNEESWVASIYVDAIKRLEKNKKLQSQVDELNKKLEDRSDTSLNILWKKTRKVSLDSFEKIYKQLNTKFDISYFESELESSSKKISKELVKKKIAKIDDGATIVNLNKYNLGIWVLLRSDGTVLYSTKDLALANKKFKDYKLDESLVLFGAAQKLHSSQLKKTLEIMKFPKWKQYNFIHFEEVRLPGKKMSSRTGENILYSEFINEISDYSKNRIKERFPKIGGKELRQRSLKIAIASIKYTMLKQNPQKNITFIKEEALDFDGNTGPYLLYSYARAKSILRKIKKKINKTKIRELKNQEINLVKKLSEFPKIVENSYKNLNPVIIANYSYELAKLFNEFYHLCPVINSENEKFRVDLVSAFSQTLENSLQLLGIDILEKM